jgi:hypothetical protein
VVQGGVLEHCKGGLHQTHLLDSAVFRFLVPNVFSDDLLVSSHRRCEKASDPGMLSHIIPLPTCINPGNVDCAFACDETDVLRHRILRRYRNYHVQVIRHQVTFLDHAFLLSRQPAKYIAQFLSDLTEDRLFRYFGMSTT